MQVGRGVLVFVAAMIAVLLTAVAFLIGERSALDTSDAAPVNFEQASPPSSISEPSQPTRPSPTIGRPINACYHTYNCNYWKIVSVAIIQERGDTRILRAELQPGEVENPSGTEEEEDRIVWNGDPVTFHAHCSLSSPKITWMAGSEEISVDFDFAEGIAGAQQNHANIYAALCHGFYDNELASQALALGY